MLLKDTLRTISSLFLRNKFSTTKARGRIEVVTAVKGKVRELPCFHLHLLLLEIFE